MKKALIVLSCIYPVLLGFPASALGATVDSSASIQKDIANVSPAAASVTEPVFVTLDSFRSSIADVLDSQLVSTQAKITSSPQLSITDISAIQDATVSNPWGMFWYVLYMLYFYVLTIVRWIVGNAIVFYIVFVLLVLYILLRVFRWWRRPRY
jgi:membrane protein insertase Oxa1/YidC/SpoIIIJ